MFDLPALKFESGAFVRGTNNQPAHIDKNNKVLHLSLDIQPLSPNEIILQISISNSGESQYVNSLFIDFEIPGFIPEQVLENGWCQSGFSGYKHGIFRTKKRKAFFLRDQNPYTFLPEYGYVPKSQISEWYTQLVGTDDTLMVGAITTSNQFTSIYIIKKDGGTFVRMACQLDGKLLPSGDLAKSESLYLGCGDRDELLEKFALLVQKHARIKSLPKPVKGLCCSYYYQGNVIDEDYVKEQLQAFDRLPYRLGLEYIQVDAGYSPWGDWLDTTKKFPSGMKSIVTEINKRGLKAGIWIAPFVASTKSRLFKEHKDWFLKDCKGRFIEGRCTSPLDFLPLFSLRVLDITKPQVQNHLTAVIEQFIEWGFEYIKTDFTYPICCSTNYEIAMTRAQALRLGFEVIKNASKGRALIQSSITPLSPLVGIADYVRTGPDTINPYLCGIPFIRDVVNNSMLSWNLRNCEARQFLNGKLWINDSDCLVCRENTGLSTQLIDKHYQFTRNYQGSIWIGDHLNNLEWNKYEKYVLDYLGYLPKEKTALSVVIPAWNEEKTIQKTFESLSRQQTKVPFEVLLVDNNCSDNTVAVVKTFDNRINHLRIICEKTQGIGAARNSGFSGAISELIASTDADTLVPEDWISMIFGRFWAEEDLAGLVGNFSFYSKGYVFNFVIRSIEITGDYLHKLFVGSFAFRGANFAIRKAYWERAGGFNSKISALEDVDLSLRVGKIGEIEYLPNLIVSTSDRRFKGRFWQQLRKRSSAYIYRVLLQNSEKYTEWEPIR